MNKLTSYVDVFYGCGAIDLPTPQGVAAEWEFIKGRVGNTSPAAFLPFGRISAGAYSGGYSSGYGNIGMNSGAGPVKVPIIMEEGTIRGFAHLHDSGTGAIRTYYNYAVTVPFFGDDLEKGLEPDMMQDESGRPGYYAVTMRERGIRGEMTVTPWAAHHRYTFPKAGGSIAVDFTHDGVIPAITPCGGMECEIIEEDTVRCKAILHGVEIKFQVRCPGSKAKKWDNGCIFTDLPAGQVRMALGLSPRSFETAAKGMDELNQDFDLLAQQAEDAWEKALSYVEIEANNEREKRIFYSNYYHTLVKPSDWTGDSCWYDDEEACILDLATLWDQYKTQTPLLMSLYPELSERLVRTITAISRNYGVLPHCLMLNKHEITQDLSTQASMLSEFVLVDAYYRGVKMDLGEVNRALRRDILPDDKLTQYKQTGLCQMYAHNVDVADGCNAAAELAKAAGDEELEKVCRELAKKWTAAFDRKTGLLSNEGFFYEGNNWNYSFRLMHDMDTRLDIAGGKEGYAKLLDQFFGFDTTNPEAGKFEGFNNETDMETPYSYYYADRHDRLCEVIHAGCEYMFTEGRGGLPGNNDSGGLSSLYMWNVMGIFPASGQNLMYIGTPRLQKAVMHLANGKDFTVRRVGEGIYVKKALLHGKVLSTMAFAVTEMMQGGELVLEMSKEPCN